MLSATMLLILSTLTIVALAALLQTDISAGEQTPIRIRRDDNRR